MQHYLTRALQDDISNVQLMNVIRIILHLPITHQGVNGEEHHLAEAKRNQDAVNKFLGITNDTEEEESEEQAVESIVSSYNETEPLPVRSVKCEEKAMKKVESSLKRDKNLFKLMLEDEDCDDDFIYDAAE